MVWATGRSERLPRDWRHKRLVVLARQKWLCAYPGCCLEAVEVDHIQRGDDHRLENLQGLCVKHHRQKTQGEALGERRRRAALRLHPLQLRGDERGGFGV